MGSAGTCCSSGNVAPDCCATGSEKLRDVPEASVLVSIDTAEVTGVEKLDPPGLQDKVDIRGREAGAATGSGNAASQEQTITYDEGSVYTGQMQDGQRHGCGLWHCRTGQYDGQWRFDMQSGSGRQTWSDGRIYDGQFKSGMFDGVGRMTWHTQKGSLTYEGQYVEDLKHGRGKFVWADGRSYDGEWQKGKRHGRGEYVNSRSEKRAGIWVADQFESWETPHRILDLEADSDVQCNATNCKELTQPSP